MDRLTARREDGRVRTTRKDYSKIHMGYVDTECINDKYDVRLASYEDTGLSPEEIITLQSIKSWSDAVEEHEERTAQENIRLKAQLERAEAVANGIAEMALCPDEQCHHDTCEHAKLCDAIKAYREG